MTLNDIRALIDIGATGRTYHTQRLPDLIRTDMIVQMTAGVDDGTFVLSPRGEVFIEMLQATPMPEQVWADPRTHTEG